MRLALMRMLTRRLLVTILGGFFLLLVVIFLIGAVVAARAVNAAKGDGNDVVAALNAGKLPQAHEAARRLREDAGTAVSATDDPLWWIGSKVPFVGANVAAVRDSATALNTIASTSLPVLLDLAGEVDNGSLRPRDGRVDPAAFTRFAPRVRQAASALDGPASAVEKIDTGDLLPPFDSLMGEVQSRVEQAYQAIKAAANAFEVMPTMLGGHGPRDYLLLVQNPAEIRATGGLPGTWAIIHADNGRLTMTDTTFLGDLVRYSDRIPLSTGEAQLFGTDFGTIPNDITGTPDFPRVAQIAAAIEKRRGVSVSAVFSVDPIALGYVLGGTGPIALQPGVQLTSANTAHYLLNALYQQIPDPGAQNEAFSLVARKTFAALVGGQGSQVNAIRGLVQAVGQRRVFAWSSDPVIARSLKGDALSGSFPQDTGKTPQVGVYLNDAVAGKPEYYLQQASSVKATGCHDGVQTLKLQTSFRSTMPTNAASLSQWIVGDGSFAKKGHIYMVMYIAAPWRGSVQSLEVNGQQLTVTSNVLNGRQMATYPIDLAPGQIATVTATLRTGPGQSAPGKLSWTPGMSLRSNPSTFASAC